MRLQRNLYLQTDLGALDLLRTISGVGNLEQVQSSAVLVDQFGRKVKVIAIEQRTKAKEVIGRQKDLLAATEPLPRVCRPARWQSVRAVLD